MSDDESGGEYGQSTEEQRAVVMGIDFRNDGLMLLTMLLGIYIIYLLAGLVIGFPFRGLMNQIGQLTFWIAVFAMASLALNLHWGYTGLFNIGIVGFMATGVYVTGILSKPVFGSGTSAAEIGGFGLPLWIGIIGGTVAAGLLGLIAALPALRLRADYLAIVTIALSEIVRFSLLSDSLSGHEIAGYRVGLGGGDGVILDYQDPLESLIRALSAPFDLILGEQGWLWNDVYLGIVVDFVANFIPNNPKPVVDNFAYSAVLLLILGGFYVVIRRMGNSPFGRVLKAIREDEDVTNALGKNTNMFKIKSFVVGCALMGLVGILWFGTQGSVTPNTFRPRITFYIWIALIIGGAGSNSGSVMGGAVFAAFLFQGPRYFKNVIETALGNPEAPSSFGQAMLPVSNGDVVPFLLYTLDSIRQLQLFMMGVVLIVLMHRRPDGMLGHRKEPASSIPLTRPIKRSGGGDTVATDGGETDE
ncbi:branched-chain amino acid transport system permease protein [Haloarchaeobius iranensis]|uniref:Branched-chain amino acid transport system permease protein n=2 Tax=Haloarchaeobius iranensis TaxID=996166 RepID=A0A1G9TXD7_9EURY|nr:branched-chain amino acid ABC transporter permease [Haloarchaeobius iranensis]SDM52406.1 branched-chain amino acid transport system permease protein [Haloarchaeobius iranensis]